MMFLPGWYIHPPYAPRYFSGHSELYRGVRYYAIAEVSVYRGKARIAKSWLNERKFLYFVRERSVVEATTYQGLPVPVVEGEWPELALWIAQHKAFFEKAERRGR